MKNSVVLLAVTALLTPPPSDGQEIQEGLWEITIQMYLGDPPSPEGRAQTTTECIRKNWLERKAAMVEGMTGASSRCKEHYNDLTPTSWRAAYDCTSRDSTVQGLYEFNFMGDTMEGTTDTVDVTNGERGRELYKTTGRHLESCACVRKSCSK